MAATINIYKVTTQTKDKKETVIKVFETIPSLQTFIDEMNESVKIGVIDSYSMQIMNSTIESEKLSDIYNKISFGDFIKLVRYYNIK